MVTLILLSIVLYLYFRPSIDQTEFGDWILWYNKYEQISKDTYKVKRNYRFLF